MMRFGIPCLQVREHWGASGFPPNNLLGDRMVAWHARSLNWARTAVGVGVLAVLAACGGGGGGSSSTSGGGGGGGSASVSGVASKGLLLNALVTAYAVNRSEERRVGEEWRSRW